MEKELEEETKSLEKHFRLSEGERWFFPITEEMHRNITNKCKTII